MNYQINASSLPNQDAVIHIKESNIDFGTTAATAESLPNPAELFLGAFAACFSKMMHFNYSKTTLEVHATRLENPPRMENVVYHLNIYSTDTKLNADLLKKNIEKHGTINNTVKLSCAISGTIKVI